MSRSTPYSSVRIAILARYQQALNCLQLLSPLVVLNLIVPPYQFLQGDSDTCKIAARTGLEYVYIIWEDLFGPYGMETLKKGAYYIGCPPENYISCIFMHYDYNHLLNNTLKLCEYGFLIYSHINAPTLYTLPTTITYLYLLYFGGGIVAALPSTLHDDDGKYNLLPYVKPLLKQSDFPYSDAIHKLVHKVTTKIGSLNVYPIVLGSTGALYALKGCSIMLQIKQLYSYGMNIYKDLQQKYRNRPSGQAFRMQDVLDSTMNELNNQLLNVVIDIFSIVTGSHNIVSEYLAIYDKSEGKTLYNFMSHSIKVQGAIFGVLFGFFYPVYK